MYTGFLLTWAEPPLHSTTRISKGGLPPGCQSEGQTQTWSSPDATGPRPEIIR